MSELLKSKHMLCALVGLVVVAGVIVYMCWPPNNSGGNCGCSSSVQYEGYVSPALRHMAENNKKENLYQPKEKLIHYNKPPSERFVPAPPGNSMSQQMNSMRGSPVSKSMNSMASSNSVSPFINYAQ